MAWAYVIRASDRAMFKRCRRAWDLSSRSRQDYEPALPVRAFDFDQAMRDALALYYFPGMWSWSREIVLPIVLDGFVMSMEKQRTACLKARGLSDQEEEAWNGYLELGQGTALEGAALEVRVVEARALCAACGTEFVQKALYMPCPCGAHNFKRITGEELLVKEYELA